MHTAMEQIENRTPKIDKQTEQAAAPEIAQTPERRAVEWEPNSEQERVGLHIYCSALAGVWRGSVLCGRLWARPPDVAAARTVPGHAV
ncbi:MAG: hypothetical protein A3H70_00605 [Candidatus Komeilibacteria bacterium RIFCSPLOWO2_02_FULL_48_11]|uniref:Uncharacterized protein n=1 Tax=Candidatus Komeilibacteria bacterium RIFCSPLOWO2_02_FULL_48_11 TaxID=1798553 RepID=A0A1G2BTS3_9BACT|nr:MAG: hypothetical protein A3H70_00605 [Candidatus Komeilibacteria bacterium RIFCSPLOWO2_02_FULL_48_11]